MRGIWQQYGFSGAVSGAVCLLLLLAGCGNEYPSRTENSPQAAGSAAMITIHEGKALFDLYCLACHDAGPGHPGTQRLQERVGEAQAALLARDNLPPDYIKLVVREGFKLMPPFRPSEITDTQLDVLAAYVAGEAQ